MIESCECVKKRLGSFKAGSYITLASIEISPVSKCDWSFKFLDLLPFVVGCIVTITSCGNPTKSPQK